MVPIGKKKLDGVTRTANLAKTVEWEGVLEQKLFD